MKTKKFFMLLAAVLLGSVSAMAQSGNNEPLKGDVNEDGTVDVADIAAVIAIIKNNAQPQTTYYWYVGTTEPTSSSDQSSEGWTRLSEKPANGIKIFKDSPDGSDVQWYLAAPADWNYVTTFNGYQVGGWTKTTISINGVSYNVWAAQALEFRVNVTLANI